MAKYASTDFKEILDVFSTYPERLSTLLHKIDKEALIRRQFVRGKRTPGQFLRSAQFSFGHYKSCPQLKVIYRSTHLSDYSQFLTANLFNFLRAKNE